MIEDKTIRKRVAQIQVRYSVKIPAAKRMNISQSRDAYKIFRAFWDMDRIELLEDVHVLFLNRANQVLGIYHLSKGGSTGCVVEVKQVLSVALKCNACSFIVAHNHPSANMKPSRTDIELTKRLKESAKVMDLSLLDHLIVCQDSYYSFADEGML